MFDILISHIQNKVSLTEEEKTEPLNIKISGQRSTVVNIKQLNTAVLVKAAKKFGSKHPITPSWGQTANR